DIAIGAPENIGNANYNPSDYKSAYTIEPKLLLNLKVAYKFYNNCSVYVNARNLLNDDKREFAFVDKVKGLYLVGVNFNF
ncbi:MAG TPA: hypothetical protein VHO90_20170, partial [Bacteroidales bacterium]|nr:hypothetical protein [Bacteroidales bacterium]